jgi:2,4-dienoyl-CoA reductase-like NADH-dependent reductase (Old Yellow Enzyme family)
LALVDAASEVYGGSEYLCVKICPTDILNDSVVSFEEMQGTYTYLIKELVLRRVGIITICRRGTVLGIKYGDDLSKLVRPDEYPLPPDYDPVLDFGSLVKSPGSNTLLMMNHGYTLKDSEQLMIGGKIDMVMIGRPFICNPVM